MFVCENDSDPETLFDEIYFIRKLLWDWKRCKNLPGQIFYEANLFGRIEDKLCRNSLSIAVVQ